jgi:hypothetical protein
MRSIARSLLFAGALVCGAEVIDRVAIVVGNNVITSSELTLQIRLAAFMNKEEPDFSIASRQRAADRLIEQVLIRREMSAPGAPPAADTGNTEKQLIGAVRARYKTDPEFKAALARYAVTNEDLQQYISWQARLLQFVDQRFRPSIALSDEDVRSYYDNTFLFQWREANPGKEPPSFESVRDEMENQALAERANNAIDRWLGQARTQTNIVFKVEDLQ